MDGSIEADLAGGGGGELRPGDSIGPYELLFHAADGGMATVWAARLRGVRGFERLVAVKLLSEALLDDRDAREMLLDEASTAARIIHPNVAQVFDYGEARGRPYIAMEWLEGESLARLAAAQRARGGRLPLRWVLQVAAAACAGLHAAHEVRDERGEPLRLVHRDVSPQNVMVTFDGFTKILDFGVAKSRRRTQVTRAGVIKGKTGYFSPEQIRGGEVDRRSDLFSFGILLYVLATDHHPFRGRSALDTVQNIASKAPYPPADLVPDLPARLDALILRALAKDPADRFQTAVELSRELEQVSMELGPRLSDRVIGAVARRLLPGIAEARRARLAEAAERLDTGRGRETGAAPEAKAPEEPRRAGQDEETVREMNRGARRVERDPEPRASNLPRPPQQAAGRAGPSEEAPSSAPASGTPPGSAIAVDVGPRGPRRRLGARLAMAAALVLLGVTVVTAHTISPPAPGGASPAVARATAAAPLLRALPERARRARLAGEPPAAITPACSAVAPTPAQPAATPRAQAPATSRARAPAASAAPRARPAKPAAGEGPPARPSDDAGPERAEKTYNPDRI
ncbi:MAG: protein kinase [Polyangiaceae bacterium]|nr:protein kinase [Polyangiaceae bacterium]